MEKLHAPWSKEKRCTRCPPTPSFSGAIIKGKSRCRTVFRVLYSSGTKPHICAFAKSGRIQIELLAEITSGEGDGLRKRGIFTFCLLFLYTVCILCKRVLHQQFLKWCFSFGENRRILTEKHPATDPSGSQAAAPAVPEG